MKSIAQAQELKFLALTLVLVVCVGVGSMFNMVRAPEVSIAKNGKNNLRVPASVPGALPNEKVVSAISKLETLDWSCGDAAKSMEVTTTRIRVKGRGCAKQTLSIKNETNGLSAIILEGEKGWSTDFMDLALGQNEISVQWQNKKGKAQVTKLTVIRN